MKFFIPILVLFGGLACCFSSSAKTPVYRPLPDDETQEIAPPEAEPLPPGAEVISGIVRIVRENPQSEIFFIDRKDSLIIPRDSRHNEIFDACLAASRTRQPVHLVVDLKNRRVLSLKSSADKADKANKADKIEDDLNQKAHKSSSK